MPPINLIESKYVYHENILILLKQPIAVIKHQSIDLPNECDFFLTALLTLRMTGFLSEYKEKNLISLTVF